MWLEPEVEVVGEYGWHGYLQPDGSVREGRVVTQVCSPAGAWKTSEVLAEPLSIEDQHRYRQEYHALIDALREASYFGPFGLDAFHYQGPSGQLTFHGCSDVNARYSMAWGLGMDGWRPSDGAEG